MTDWDQHLCLAQFAMNSARHETIQQTPFFMADHPRQVLLMHDNPASYKLTERLQQLDARARKHFGWSATAQAYYDAKHVLAVFAVKDEVVLSTSGLLLKIAGPNKLAPCFVGPFKVLQRISGVAYWLDLPETMRTHTVFHVSLLKRYHSDGRATY